MRKDRNACFNAKPHGRVTARCSSNCMRIVEWSLPRSRYLSLTGSQSKTANWEATQCHGLMITGLAYPEFNASTMWLKQGLACIEQLLSDGVVRRYDATHVKIPTGLHL